MKNKKEIMSALNDFSEAVKAIKPRCPSCHGRQIQYLKRDKSFWCRVCGHEWKKELNK